MVRVKYLDCERLPALKRVWWYGYGSGLMHQMEGFLDLMFARGLHRKLTGALRSAAAFTRKGRL
jgi:hypothetical protein